MTTAKPKVAFYWCESCGGCKETVVDLNDAILDVAAAVDIVFWPVALDFKRKDVEAIPGCPPTPELLADAVKAVLSGTLPPRGAVLAPDRAVCDTCPRKDTRPDKLLLSGFRRPHEIEIDEEKCFLGQTLPCLGSATRGGWGQLCLIAPDIGNRHPHNHAALHIGRELDVVGGPKAAVPHLHHAGVGIGRRHPRGVLGAQAGEFARTPDTLDCGVQPERHQDLRINRRATGPLLLRLDLLIERGQGQLFDQGPDEAGAVARRQARVQIARQELDLRAVRRLGPGRGIRSCGPGSRRLHVRKQRITRDGHTIVWI